MLQLYVGDHGREKEQDEDQIHAETDTAQSVVIYTIKELF